MNEIQYLRAQLATERRDLAEVVSHCAVATREALRQAADFSHEFLVACANYLMFFIEKERARAAVQLQRPHNPGHLEPLRAALAAADQAAARLSSLLEAQDGGTTIRDAVADLAGTAAALEALADSRAAVMALAASRYTLEDWRRTALVDADGILEERRLHAEVLRNGPRPAQ